MPQQGRKGKNTRCSRSRTVTSRVTVRDRAGAADALEREAAALAHVAKAWRSSLALSPLWGEADERAGQLGLDEEVAGRLLADIKVTLGVGADVPRALRQRAAAALQLAHKLRSSSDCEQQGLRITTSAQPSDGTRISHSDYATLLASCLSGHVSDPKAALRACSGRTKTFARAAAAAATLESVAADLKVLDELGEHQIRLREAGLLDTRTGVRRAAWGVPESMETLWTQERQDSLDGSKAALDLWQWQAAGGRERAASDIQAELARRNSAPHVHGVPMPEAAFNPDTVGRLKGADRRRGGRLPDDVPGLHDISAKISYMLHSDRNAAGGWQEHVGPTQEQLDWLRREGEAALASTAQAAFDLTHHLETLSQRDAARPLQAASGVGAAVGRYRTTADGQGSGPAAERMLEAVSEADASQRQAREDLERSASTLRRLCEEAELQARDIGLSSGDTTGSEGWSKVERLGQLVGRCADAHTIALSHAEAFTHATEHAEQARKDALERFLQDFEDDLNAAATPEQRDLVSRAQKALQRYDAAQTDLRVAAHRASEALIKSVRESPALLHLLASPQEGEQEDARRSWTDGEGRSALEAAASDINWLSMRGVHEDDAPLTAGALGHSGAWAHHAEDGPRGMMAAADIPEISGLLGRMFPGSAEPRQAALSRLRALMGDGESGAAAADAAARIEGLPAR